MTDIIAAIDHATGCQQCGKDLTGSVSDDFCSEECQRGWQAVNVAHVKQVEPEVNRRIQVYAGGFAAAMNAALEVMEARFTFPAGGQVFRPNGETWEPFGTITSGFTVEERR